MLSQKFLLRRITCFCCVILFVLLASNSVNSLDEKPITVNIYPNKIGKSSSYIGACEGNTRFNIADIDDLGINTYRVYGGMPRWERIDDDKDYGSPTISQIKQNPNVINWSHWDKVMTYPDQGSDYSFSGKKSEVWQGNARTIFKSLRERRIRTVISLRNTSPRWEPSWALQLNPPRTEADRNEWWEHVFATVYWLNVRNDYHVDDFEIHNEPDNREQGWGGSQKDYFELVRISHDAIEYVYSTYLPNRTFQIHAPKTIGGSHWPHALLAEESIDFDIINVHNYALDIASYIRKVRHWIDSNSKTNSPIWIGEWGTYKEGYDDLNFSLNLLGNLIEMSRPDKTHVLGSHIFSMYDWGITNGFKGLIDARGQRRLAYYALRMGIRGLQGGKDVLLTDSSSDSKVTTLATRDFRGYIYLMTINKSVISQAINVNVPMSKGTVEVWEFSNSIKDEKIGNVDFQSKEVSVKIPPFSSRLLVFSESTY